MTINKAESTLFFMIKEWTQAYEVGDHDVDNHHQEVFELTSLLDQIVNGQEDVLKIILFLEDHIVTHFQEEEALMKKIGFSESKEHLQDHKRFKDQVLEIRKTYDDKLKQQELIFQIRKLIDDLIHHIRVVDIKLARANHDENTP